MRGRANGMELDYLKNQDCFEGLKNIPDGSVDMILCDLPYGMTANKWDTQLDMDALWKEYKRVCKPNAAIVLFSQMPFSATLVLSNPRMFRYEWIYEKCQGTGHLSAKHCPLKAHENVLVFYKSRPTYNPQMVPGKPYKKNRRSQSTNYEHIQRPSSTVCDGWRYPTDIVKVTRKQTDQHLHPTQKPVELCEYFIKTYTNPGDIVLDNCAGSGTTMIACLNTDRHYIGFELDPGYFQVASKRIEDHRISLLKLEN
jgi:site-specific DNA-methyltransferase (adenine-specific)